MFNKAIEILYLAEICKYMKTPHSCHDFGPTLDTELNVNKYVRMLNDIDTQQDSQSWASLTSPGFRFSLSKFQHFNIKLTSETRTKHLFLTSLNRSHLHQR